MLNFGRFYYTGWRPQLHIDFGPVRQMFAFSVKLLITNIINTVSNNVLTFIFGRFYPIDDVGNYSQAYNWNTKANSFISNTVGQIAQPVLSSVKDDRGKEQQVFRKMFRFTSFLSFPLMFGLALVSHEFILITISDKWIASVPLLQILSVSGAFVPLYTLYQNLAISNGRSDVYMWCNLGQVVGLLALVLCCHSYGIYWMVVAYTAFMILWLLVWQGRHQTHHRLALQGCLSRHTSLPVLCGRLYGGNLLSHLLAVEHLPALAGKNHPASSLYFAVMKLLRVKILEECLTFMKKKKK